MSDFNELEISDSDIITDSDDSDHDDTDSDDEKLNKKDSTIRTNDKEYAGISVHMFGKKKRLEQKQKVVSLNKESLSKINKPIMVKFYVKWCGHCQDLKPIYEELANQVNCEIYEVDCEEQKELAELYEIDGFPTIKIIHNGKTIETYNKSRTVKAMKAWMEEKLNRKVISLNKESLSKINKPIVVKFYAPWCGHCVSLKPIYEELANQLDCEIYEVNCDEEKELMKLYEIKGFPTIKLIHNEKTIDTYNKTRTLENMKAWIDEKLKESKGRFSKNGYVMEVNELPIPSIVMFYMDGCPYCEKLIPTYQEVVDLIKIPCYAVNSNNEILCTQYGIQTFPVIGQVISKTEMNKYTGDRSMKDLLIWIQNTSGHVDSMMRKYNLS